MGLRRSRRRLLLAGAMAVALLAVPALSRKAPPPCPSAIVPPP